jgi:hypothetical protein
MSEPSLKARVETAAQREPADKPQEDGKPQWETPRMEDVSEEVMAQPYIRFT